MPFYPSIPDTTRPTCATAAPDWLLWHGLVDFSLEKLSASPRWAEGVR